MTSLGFNRAAHSLTLSSYRTGQLLTLKIGTAGKESPEVSISEYLKDFGSEHPGLQNIRVSLDDFVLESPAGVHQCLVFEPLAFTYTEVRDMCPGKLLCRDMTQGGLNMILFVLDLLHQAGVVHTGGSFRSVLPADTDMTCRPVSKQHHDERQGPHSLVKHRRTGKTTAISSQDP